MIGAGAILGTATWLLASAVAPPAPLPTTGSVEDTVLFEPLLESEVSSFVTACELADASEIPRLRQMAGSEDPLVAGRAIAALGRLGSVHDDPELLKHLQDPRPRVRHETIIDLGSSGEKHVVPLLIPILEEKDSQAQLLAITALGQLGATASLTELAQAPGTDPTTRAFAKGALQTIPVPEFLATTVGLK